MTEPHRVGAVAMSAFAFLWAATGASGFGGLAGGIVIVVAGLITAAAIRFTWHVQDTPNGGLAALPADWARRLNRIGGIQAAAIVGVVVLLGRLQTPGHIPSAVCAIVALHFLPLASLFDQPRFRWTAGALLVVAVAGAGIAATATNEMARSLVGLGAAAILWSSTISPAVVRGRAREGSN